MLIGASALAETAQESSSAESLDLQPTGAFGYELGEERRPLRVGMNPVVPPEEPGPRRLEDGPRLEQRDGFLLGHPANQYIYVYQYMFIYIYTYICAYMYIYVHIHASIY